MGKKKIKNPHLDGSTRLATPSIIPEFSSNEKHPAFCFRYIQNSFSLNDCDKDTQAACAKRLQLLGQQTWGDIQQTPRHGQGHEIINQNSILKPLPKDTPGDRKFLVFRLGGGKQSTIIGYRKEKIFYIVWIDPEGKVYKHG